MKFKYPLLLVVIIFLNSFSAFAQRVDIKGRVVEVDKKTAIEQATVRLVSITDSAMVAGVVSEANGTFTLKRIRPGNYLLHISFIGYKPLYQAMKISGQKDPVQLGNLILEDDAIALGEAVVTGKAPEVKMRNDTVEYNADSYKIMTGSTLEDLLKKMPGVEVSSDGTITINGKEIKKIMVDGKEFFSSDPKVASKNLPAKMIDKIQVLDKLSDMAQMTGFDDGDEETIINLTVKKGMKRGWFGTTQIGYGNEDRYEGNFMVNRFLDNDQFTIMGGLNNTNNMGFTDFASSMMSGMGGGGRRRGGGAGNGITTSSNLGANFSKDLSTTLTVGGNTRYSHTDNDAESKINRENILTGDSSSYYNENNFSNTKSDNIGMDFRMVWKPSDKTTVIFTPSIKYSNQKSLEDGTFETLDGNKDLVNKGTSNYYTEGDGYDADARLDFSHQLNDEGRVFSGSLRGGLNDASKDGTNYSNTEYSATSTGTDQLIDQAFHYDNDGYNGEIRTSWVEPIGNNNFIQAKYEAGYTQSRSIKRTFSKNDNNAIYDVLDTAYSKSYENEFIKQRVGLAFKMKRDKYNLTMGANLDPSHSKSRMFVGDETLSSLTRNVLNFSPEVRFNYMFDKKSNLRLQYSGRTSQPSVTQLQPIDDVSDPLNTVTGNPDLNPSYTHRILGFYQVFKPESQFFAHVMTYNSFTQNDIVSYSVYEEGTGRKTTSYTNVNGNYSLSLRGMFGMPFKNKKFSFFNMVSTRFSNSNGFINAQQNQNQNFSGDYRMHLNFRSDYLDFGVNGSLGYSNVSNSLQTSSDQSTYDYGSGANTTLYLPWNLQLESDLNYSTNSGYSDGFKKDEVLWNASLSKSFLKGNSAILRLKFYDILKNRSNISRSITSNYTQDIEYNTLTSYFIVHFIYKFNIFKGGSTMKDVKIPGGDRHRGHGPGGRPGGPR